MSHKDKRRKVDEKNLRLHKEDLDIDKSSHQVGEVELGKEIVEEKQSVDVPVSHGEVVIEQHDLNNQVSDEPIEEETMHIPIGEERVHVGKHTELTGEVAAHKSSVEETEEVEEELKREKARVDSEGDPNIVDTDSEDYH